jgi:hypothetical protein
MFHQWINVYQYSWGKLTSLWREIFDPIYENRLRNFCNVLEVSYR